MKARQALASVDLEELKKCLHPVSPPMLAAFTRKVLQVHPISATLKVRTSAATDIDQQYGSYTPLFQIHNPTKACTAVEA